MATETAQRTDTDRRIEDVSRTPLIRSNHGEYVSSESVGLLQPTAKDTPLEEMRRRLDEAGVLWVKDLLPKEDVWKMREHYFRFMEPTGILKPGSDPREGIFNDEADPMAHQGIGGTLPQAADEVDRLVAAHVTPEYLEFSRHPALRAFVRRLTGWSDEVECTRTLLRHNLPASESTAIHYDQIFLRGSSSFFVTAWVPIGDCGPNGGGLMYLERSSGLGESLERDFTARAQVLPAAERISAYNEHMSRTGTLSQDAAAFARERGGGRRWLTAAYEAGDVVFHDPYIVHAAGRNDDPRGRIRLSTDLRFYEKGPPMDERWMKPWVPDDRL